MTQKVKKRKTNKKTRHHSSNLIFLVFIVLIIAIYGWALKPLPQMISSYKELSNARQQENDLKAENVKLKDEKKALYRDKQIEEIARREYGYIKPDEKAYIVLTPKKKEIPLVKTEEKEIKKEEPHTFLEKLIGW